MPAVRQHEHERAAREAEERAPRERRELHDEEERQTDREGRLQPVPGFETEVERRQDEERDDELDPEMVRVAGERVRAEDLLRPADRAEDVDPGLARRDRLDEQLVEVHAALGEDELDDAVDGVQADPSEERCEGVPVEANVPAREKRDPGDEEAEVQDELHHALRPLRERLSRVEAVEAGEVDERERDEERQRDDRRTRKASVALLDAVPDEEHEEHRGQDVRERERPRELPLQLVERHGEHRQQEQPVEHGLDEDTVALRAPRERAARGSSHDLLDEGRHLLDARASREPRPRRVWRARRTGARRS